MTLLKLRLLVSFALLCLCTTSFAQSFNLPNEEVVFSFTTQSGKLVTLNKDKTNEYLIYRFGTKSKIEFEFPEKTKASWSQFKFSFYMRGGGAQNEGMDLNYVYFTNKEFQYIIFDTYYAAGNKHDIGIKIINLQTKKATTIKGIRKTQVGNLTDFRDNNLLEIGEELFD
jgi:hypothetical protein